MIQYAEDNDVAVADGLTFRRDKRTGYFLSGAPINGKRKRLHVYIWEKENGPVPNGFNVHHVDEDKMNNDISNLKLLSVHEHQHLHSKERFAKNPEWEKRFIEQGQKCAKKWHGSEAGHEWHKLHFQKNKDALFREREVICEYCGKKFIAHIGKKHHFCSGNCKSAYRRKMGENAYATISDTWNAQVASGRFVELAREIIKGNTAQTLFEDGPCSSAEILDNGWYHANES